jgi:hypothetical protein
MVILTVRVLFDEFNRNKVQFTVHLFYLILSHINLACHLPEDRFREEDGISIKMNHRGRGDR